MSGLQPGSVGRKGGTQDSSRVRGFLQLGSEFPESQSQAATMTGYVVL